MILVLEFLKHRVRSWCVLDALLWGVLALVRWIPQDFYALFLCMGVLQVGMEFRHRKGVRYVAVGHRGQGLELGHLGVPDTVVRVEKETREG